MNGFVFLLMMLSQMNPEDLVMQLKEPLKNDQRKDFKEKKSKHGGSNFNVPSFENGIQRVGRGDKQ